MLPVLPLYPPDSHRASKLASLLPQLILCAQQPEHAHVQSLSHLTSLTKGFHITLRQKPKLLHAACLPLPPLTTLPFSLSSHTPNSTLLSTWIDLPDFHGAVIQILAPCHLPKKTFPNFLSQTGHSTLLHHVTLFYFHHRHITI